MELQFNPVIQSSNHDKIKAIIDAFFTQYSSSIFDESDTKIDFNHFYVPNHAAIFNKISDIGIAGFPIAQSNSFMLLELPSGLSVYRLEDVDQGSLIKSNS